MRKERANAVGTSWAAWSAPGGDDDAVAEASADSSADAGSTSAGSDAARFSASSRRRTVFGALFFFVVVSILLGTFAFEAAENHDWYRHLTHWAWVAHALLVLLLLAEYWETKLRVFRDGVLLIGSTIAAGIIGGMIVLYAQDTSVLDEAEEMYGRDVMAVGNFFLHFAPSLLYWGFHVAHLYVNSIHTHMIAQNESSYIAFSFLHFNVVMEFYLVYGSIFNVRAEYGEKINPISMGAALVIVAFVNYALFVETLIVKSKG
jgi:hypothetical protein